MDIYRVNHFYIFYIFYLFIIASMRYLRQKTFSVKKIFYAKNLVLRQKYFYAKNVAP